MLFIMLCNADIMFESVDELLNCAIQMKGLFLLAWVLFAIQYFVQTSAGSI